MHNTLKEKLEEYKAITGVSFDPSKLPTPQSISVSQLALVRQIMMLYIGSRQEDLMLKIQSLPKTGNMPVIQDVKQSMLKELQHLDDIGYAWESIST